MSSFFKVKLQLPGLAILALLQFEQSMPAIAEVVVQPSGAVQSALVEKRDAETLRKDGEALIYVPDPSLRNVTAGVDLLQQSADSGNVKAMLTLGSLYLYGGALPASRATALKYFERAAAAGDSSGMAQYGMMLMWSESDWSRAQKMLTRAGEDGDASAWTTLAEGAMYGYLGGGRYSRAKFDAFAAKARAAGSTRIEVLEATRQMWGISMRADGGAAVATLRNAADKGNVDAAKFLISLLRDGNGMNVSRDTSAATEAVNRYADIQSKAEIWQYDVSITASRARDVSGYAALGAEIATHPEWINTALGTELQKTNPPAALYVLQQRLKAKGLYLGPLDGLAGHQTLRAMYEACDRLWDRSGCDDNLLKPSVIVSLISAVK